jgi:glycogen synthase kinase 3 beta
LLTYLAELSIRPELNQQLVPQHARAALRAQGIDIDSLDFQPMKKEDMLARLD